MNYCFFDDLQIHYIILGRCKTALYYWKYLSQCNKVRPSHHFCKLLDVNIRMLHIDLSILLSFSKTEHYSLWSVFDRMKRLSYADEIPAEVSGKWYNLLLAQKEDIDRVLELRNRSIAHWDIRGRFKPYIGMDKIEELMKIIEMIFLDFIHHSIGYDPEHPIVFKTDFDKHHESLSEALSV